MIYQNNSLITDVLSCLNSFIRRLKASVESIVWLGNCTGDGVWVGRCTKSYSSNQVVSYLLYRVCHSTW